MGFIPTAISVRGTFVAVSNTLTLASSALSTYILEPSGVMAMPPLDPCLQGAVAKTTLLVALISVMPPAVPGTYMSGPLADDDDCWGVANIPRRNNSIAASARQTIAN